MSITFGIITLFPDMLNALRYGITKRALDKNIVALHTFNPRDYSEDPHRRVDDRPYGGGPGMVMMFQPLQQTIKAAKQKLGDTTPIIHLTPQGKPLNQDAITHLANKNKMILLLGRYEGIDERVIHQHVDEEWSIGDFVVSGGELPAMLLIDAITRLQPDALGHEDSAQQDSFIHGLLDHPHYTRPDTISEKSVPKILLSGDHKAIAEWRLKQALGRTWQRRPDLLKRRTLSQLEQQLLTEFIQEIGQNNGED